ncbi:LysR substrate-binding protein [Actinobacteria bacterium OV320]|nr:LysR substrate-binding protein [Actinobacteria bacterium OV320]
MRRGHPLTRVEAVTAARYAEAEYITISRRGRFDNALDEALALLGLTRRVVATAPTEGAGLEFVRESDLLVTAPESTTHAAAADLGPVLLPLPFELPSDSVYLSWHQRYDTDPAHVWLRGLARAALAGPTRGRNQATR